MSRQNPLLMIFEDAHGPTPRAWKRGDILNATGDQASASENYHRALAVARQQSAKTLELRAATSLARFWREQDRRTEARDLLSPVHNWFTEGFDTPVLQEAKKLLDQLSADEHGAALVLRGQAG